MSRRRKTSPDTKGVTFMYVSPSETKGTRLAHWPPPRFARATTPILPRQAATETPELATPRGWRLTRAIVSEFAEEAE